jgi:hypothetical protein
MAFNFERIRQDLKDDSLNPEVRESLAKRLIDAGGKEVKNLLKHQQLQSFLEARIDDFLMTLSPKPKVELEHKNEEKKQEKEAQEHPVLTNELKEELRLCYSLFGRDVQQAGDNLTRLQAYEKALQLAKEFNSSNTLGLNKVVRFTKGRDNWTANWLRRGKPATVTETVNEDDVGVIKINFEGVKELENKEKAAEHAALVAKFRGWEKVVICGKTTGDIDLLLKALNNVGYEDENIMIEYNGETMSAKGYREMREGITVTKEEARESLEAKGYEYDEDGNLDLEKGRNPSAQAPELNAAPASP